MTLRRRSLGRIPAALALTVGASAPAHAAPIDGGTLQWFWGLPFAGILLCIATGPLLFPKLWHNHYGKFAAALAAATVGALAAQFGVSTAWGALTHALLEEYLSFIVLLFALYVVAGGILVAGIIQGTPASNTAMLAIGAAMASIVGTTGAAMILIRPLLRANQHRPRNAHVVIFFILIVANIGGALTPLGDPPLFVGFLRGVDFFWTARHIWIQTAIAAGLTLMIFAAVDGYFARQETKPIEARTVRLTIHGQVNLVLIVGIVGAILVSAHWKSGMALEFSGTRLALENVLRDGSLILIALLSLWLTPREHRASNGFSWEPIREVAILFAAIFVAIVPVLAMLDAGAQGLFAPLLGFVTTADGASHEVAYFWLTGALSAFLDNAPTYIVFFELAGGDPQHLMGPAAGTLAAISMGAVYMGALTYIGNAPNFMIYAIATERGIRMPSFFGYLFYASLILIPIFLLLTALPLAPVWPIR